MSGRPIGPKKLAAMEQVATMRSQGRNDADIREALLSSGLTRQQARELVPLSNTDLMPAPMIVTPADDEDKKAVYGGAVHFLESIAKRITPNMCDRFTDLGMVKHDALTWARKVKGAM